MIDDEIDRRAHFVITETPSTVLHTGPTDRASHGHVVAVVDAGRRRYLRLRLITPCSVRRADDRWQSAGADRGQMPPGGPRARPVAHLRGIVHLCSKIGPDIQYALVRRYLTRLEKGGRK